MEAVFGALTLQGWVPDLPSDIRRQERDVDQMLIDAVLVTVLGMTGVFAFLLLLVGVMQAIVRLVPAPAVLPATPGPTGGDPAVVAAIQAAIQAYEEDRQ